MSLGAKLLAGALILVGVTGYVAYLGASSSWQYYLTVDECAENKSKLIARRVRVSGSVAPNSLQIANDRDRATFVLQGNSSTLPTAYRGPLPDNLTENVSVVVEGSILENGVLQGDKVLTRCASKYESEH
jgi:cytochrome c-type biogenesis protein CcmE